MLPSPSFFICAGKVKLFTLVFSYGSLAVEEEVASCDPGFPPAPAALGTAHANTSRTQELRARPSQPCSTQEPLPNLTEAIPGEAKFTLCYALGLKLAVTACKEKKTLQQL